MTHAQALSPAEQRWIDQHPVVHFSIHEKYAPYLQSNDKGSGVFHALLKKLGEFTGQEFLPKWRNTDQEGLNQLAAGEVDFMIDPPNLNDEYLRFGSLSEAIFWGHDAVLTASPNSIEKIAPANIAYFDRGYENQPIPRHPKAKLSNNAQHLVVDLLKNDVEALVLPIRLAHQLVQDFNTSELRVDGLYKREPFEYRWLISNQDRALHGLLNNFLYSLDPIESSQLFALGNSSFSGNKSPYWGKLPWLFTLTLMALGSILFWRLQKKQSLQEQATEDLIASKELAENANAAKSAFLATMSHEIRTPMNAILGVQELLLSSRQFPDSEKSLLKSAHSSAESLLGILNQVLDLSKIEAGKLTLNLEPCCLNTLIDDIHSGFSTVANKQGLLLHTSKDPRIAAVLMIDTLRLRQILQNLLSNAIKFTDRGEVYFSISVLADDHAGQLIEFRVIDTGIGMGSEEIKLALQAFEQVPGKTDQQNGTGLGLTITNHLVNSMNSQLYFESAPGFGSNIHFCVAFPRTSIAVSRNSISDRSWASKKLASRNIQYQDGPLKALVVEDHPASRQIISLQLQALGAQVSVCESANKAIELISQQDFDLLLTDQSIPGMQGSELAKHLRALGYGEIVIIGITADIYALDARHQFLAAGMNGVLIKPLSLMTLENELARYFSIQEVSEKNEEPEVSQEYSFELFSNLLQKNPGHIVLILDEIKKVHDDTLAILKSETVNEEILTSLIHKIKGGAQLLSAQRFIAGCEVLETAAPIPDRVSALIQLLEDQNRIIEYYRSKYISK
ncbi:ATP-binding protein [Polynucleobacter sp. MWH-Berg-3C6]|uniref:ATP-binding protein n=1 Tax=Polynucleobacter sp. MWH-Berg-3C6 TaxID=1855882 RepID=UPI00210238BB|nr:ATP-binding protein [Polynucleobacter sp. MWH-Berg-3C6]